MKSKIIRVIAPIIAISCLLVGCSKTSYGTIQVETRVYTGDMEGLEFGEWEKTKYPVEQGATVLFGGTYPLTATVSNIYKDGIRLKFSGEVAYPEENTSSNNYYLERNKTYIFVAGGGVDGMEIKVRYN